MQAIIGSLRVNLGLDSAQFSQGLNQAQSSLTAFGKRMATIGAGMSVAITGPLAIAAKDMVGLFSEQQDAMALVTQGVEATGGAAGKTAEELFEMASALQETSRFGDEAILKGVTAQLLTFTNIADEEFGRAQQAILDVSTVLDKDLKSTAIQVGKALNDPVRGISALAESGIQFTESQKETIKALAETGRVAEAQGLILDELSKQYGGQAAAAAETLAGKQEQLANAWGDVREEFGAIVAEVLPPLVKAMRGLVEVLQGLSPETKRWVVIVAGIAAALGPVLTALGLFAVALGAISAPILAVAAGVAALTAALVAFGPEINAAKESIVQFALDVEQYFQDLSDKIEAKIRALIDAMPDLGRDILLGMLDGLNSVGSLTDKIAGVGESIKSKFKGVLGMDSPSKVFREFGQFIMEGLGLGIADGLAAAEQPMASVLDGLSQKVSGFFKGILFEGRSFREQFASLLSGIGGRLFDRGVSGLLGAAFRGFGGARAIGGPVTAGTPYLVGERGEELFVPQRSGRIVPNHKIPDSMGGGMTRVEVVPSPYFDVRVDDRARGVAAPMVANTARAQHRSYGNRAQNYQRRGTN